jgi:perosamine synthetase
MGREPDARWLDAILERIEGVLPAERPIPLHEPDLQANAWERVKDCLDSGWVSSAGPYVDGFERGLAEYTGVEHAVAVVNGTAALHVCLELAGVVPDDEVLLPALTFVGTANPVAMMGAVPHLVDSGSETLGVDPRALRAHLEGVGERRDGGLFNRHTGRRIRALVVVHALGHVADMPRLCEVADAFELKLIEDAAEALGSFRDARHAGAWGELSALSFNGNKIITTGGGGAVLTRSADLAARAKHWTTTAKLPHPWAFDHDAVAVNYRLPNLNASLGVAQLERLPEMRAAKRRLADRYRARLGDLEGVECFAEPAGCEGNQWLNLLLVPDVRCRDALLAAGHERGLMLRPFWKPMHHLPMYAPCPRAALPVAEELFERGVCLPSSARLGRAGEAPPTAPRPESLP